MVLVTMGTSPTLSLAVIFPSLLNRFEWFTGGEFGPPPIRVPGVPDWLPFDLPSPQSSLREQTVPLFRARLIGLGFDTERELVLIELRERSDDEEEDDETSAVGDDDGYVARIYATRAQVRAMAASGAEAVAGGRPPCPLCEQPMDPSGHTCPRWN